jgi:hypothetical protein
MILRTATSRTPSFRGKELVGRPVVIPTASKHPIVIPTAAKHQTVIPTEAKRSGEPVLSEVEGDLLASASLTRRPFTANLRKSRE